MEATDWIAGYAAVVATAAFGWEVWKTIRARRPPVEVKLSNALLTFLPDPPWAAMVNVLNHGSQPIRVNSAGFNFQDGSGQTVVIMQPPPQGDDPWCCGARRRRPDLAAHGRAGTAGPLPAAGRLGFAGDGAADSLQVFHAAEPVEVP